MAALDGFAGWARRRGRRIGSFAGDLDLYWSRARDRSRFELQQAQAKLQHGDGQQDETKDDRAGSGREPVCETKVVLRAYEKVRLSPPEEVEAQVDGKGKEDEEVEQSESEWKDITGGPDLVVEPCEQPESGRNQQGADTEDGVAGLLGALAGD
jgi:hypothetical protein